MARPSAVDRVRRVLAMVPWIAGHDGPTVDEICERFEIDREQLMRDLDVVFLVGLPPYTPDALIEVDIAGDRVWIRYADYFRRPLRVTADEGVALLAAAAAVRNVPGFDPEGPLARGTAKLAAALGVDPEDDLRVELGSGDDDLLATLDRGVAEHRTVRIAHHSDRLGELVERDVDPHRIVAEQGAWYLLGYCHLVDDQRVFRLDRIASASLTDRSFDPPVTPPEVEIFAPGDEAPRVTLDLPPDAGWVVEHHPTESVEEQPGGRLRVRMAVASRPFLERLLLKVGPEAEVVDAPADLAGAHRERAAQLLERYRLERG